MFNKILNKLKINNQKGVMKGNIINSPNALIRYDLYDEINKLLQSGMFTEAIQLIERMMKGTSAQHPLHPYYRFDIVYDPKTGIQFSHTPTSQEAFEKYPIHGTMGLVMPEEMKDKYHDINEMIQDAYWNQTSLTFDATTFKTMIGNDFVIQDFEAGNGETAIVTITPQKFPPPRPMKLFIVGKEFSIDYLLLGVARIENNGRVLVLNNYKQENARLLFQLKANLDTASATFNLKSADDFLDDVRTQYELAKFLYEVDGHQIGLEDLETGNEIFTQGKEPATVDFVDRGFLAKRVDFLDKLLKMQRYFHVEFTLLDRDLTQDEIDVFSTLLCIMDGKPVELTYNNFVVMAKGKEQVKSIIDSFNSGGLKLKLEGRNGQFELLGAKIAIGTCTFEFPDPVIVKDFDQIKKRYEIMGDGDSLEIVYIPENLDKNDISAFYNVNV